MLAKMIDKIVSLKETKIFEIDGQTYADASLTRIPPHVDRPDCISVSGLDSICKLIRTELIRIKLIRHVVRSAPCGMPRRLVSHVPDNFGFPTFLKTVDTEHQHAQIQNILPCIAPFDISPTERTFIDFLEKCTPPSIGSQGSLSTGIGAVRPLG